VDGEAAAMMRATGFLLGAVLMLALFLLALDTGISPTLVKEIVSNDAELHSAPAGPKEALVPIEAVEPVEPIKPVEPKEPDAASEPATPEPHAVVSAALPVADTASLDAADRPEVNGSGLELDPQLWNQSMANYETADQNDITTASRYLVWSPFRSKWAAEGFARRLTVATEVAVEVVDTGPGNYQVVFSYRDDDERQAMVERIETVTGLELE
jgi:hypothetical protein